MSRVEQVTTTSCAPAISMDSDGYAFDPADGDAREMWDLFSDVLTIFIDNLSPRMHITDMGARRKIPLIWAQWELVWVNIPYEEQELFPRQLEPSDIDAVLQCVDAVLRSMEGFVRGDIVDFRPKNYDEGCCVHLVSFADQPVTRLGVADDWPDELTKQPCRTTRNWCSSKTYTPRNQPPPLSTLTSPRRIRLSASLTSTTHFWTSTTES
jgi:hypothetical protein